MKGLEVFPTLLVAKFQASEVSEPTERALHDVAGRSQSAAVRAVFPQRFQEGFDAQPFYQPSRWDSGRPGSCRPCSLSLSLDGRD